MEQSQTLTIDGMGRVIIPKELRDALGFEDQGLAIQALNKRRGVSISKATTNTPKKDTKKLDVDGRLLIPAQYRRELEWAKGKQLELEMESQYAVLQESPDRCTVCGSKKHLLHVKEEYVCEDCLNTGNDTLVHKWMKGLDDIAHEYMEYCEKCLSFEDTEDVHQARVKGRRMEMILGFLQVEKQHPLLEKIQEAHDKLGKVRESDVFIEQFYKRLEQEEDPDKAEVYRQYMELREEKRRKQQKKLKKNLPDIINEQFMEEWVQFRDQEARHYVLSLHADNQLEPYEQSFNAQIEKFEQEAEDSGLQAKSTLKALHKVRIESKALRYIHKYIANMYGQPYKKRAKHFKKAQKELGHINDLRDFLKELKDNQKKVEMKKDQIQLVKTQLEDELTEQLEALNIEQYKLQEA